MKLCVESISHGEAIFSPVALQREPTFVHYATLGKLASLPTSDATQHPVIW